MAVHLESERDHHRELRDENMKLNAKVLELTAEASTFKGRLAERTELKTAPTPQAVVSRTSQKPKAQVKKDTSPENRKKPT
jgi:hypothetical protein